MSSNLSKKRIRYSFGQYNSDKAIIPNLITIQCRSYEDFFQLNVPINRRKNKGLENVLRSTFNIDDHDGKLKMEYISYSISEPKYTPTECIHRGANFSSSLKVMLRIVLWDDEHSDIPKGIKDIKEQEVYFGEVPLMTTKGTFIINGVQRVIVSQLYRSPGVYYTCSKSVYSAKIIPYRGSWFEFEFDKKNLLYFKIDKKKKLPISTLLRALGFTTEKTLNIFYNKYAVRICENHLITEFRDNKLANYERDKDIIDYDTNKLSIKFRTVGDVYNKKIVMRSAKLIGSFVAKPVLDSNTGSVLIEVGEKLTDELIKLMFRSNVTLFYVVDVNNLETGSYILNTIFADKNKNENEALLAIYKILRPSEMFTFEAARELFFSIFSDGIKYNLSEVGRMKINMRHGTNVNNKKTTLCIDDFIHVIKNIVKNRCGTGFIDDIDSLSNRRVRSVGELVENQFRIGFAKMNKMILDRIAASDINTVQPHDLVNTSILISTLREFFGMSQLSQFMDQTNPLSEITHKRRLSALGPGGLTRDRAGFEVRDVHTTHYSRICPIETPEGQNIGLISSLATYAGINKYGFIESPFRKVKRGFVTNEVVYLTSVEEEECSIANCSNKTTQDGFILNESVICRKKGEIIKIKRAEIDYVDISPQQLVSVGASLIPFLENDDANRALMGSNMQRQAVPLIIHEAPFVGTGIEFLIAKNSDVCLMAKRSGEVFSLDSKRIVIKVNNNDNEVFDDLDIYYLVKYEKSNQGTCLNHKPLVDVKDYVNKGDIIADGVCTDNGELALGKNVFVAFMTWNGYNFEDSIILSERLVRDDVFTSIHIKEYEALVRDTRLGPEEITRELPNISDDDIVNLDEMGIVNIGAKVYSGDILVGKVTPKTESLLTPEEKLLKAIFGEKASDVKNSSLKIPPGERGVVIDVKIFTKRGVDKDERALGIERKEIDSFFKDKNNECAIVEKCLHEKINSIILNQKVVKGGNFFKNNSIITNLNLKKTFDKQIFKVLFSEERLNKQIHFLADFYKSYVKKLEDRFNKKVDKLQYGDDLPQGVLKVVKIYVASKLKIQAGDKMAGRHGNKGIVSKIVPIEDMPFLENGNIVDIILNPLGVPSRMNIGQILETHLGWASEGIANKIRDALFSYEFDRNEENKNFLKEKLKAVFDFGSNESKRISNFIELLSEKDLLEVCRDTSRGIKFATPVFDGANDEEINYALYKGGINFAGQEMLRDGKTGELFDREVTVGYIYMMKLDHLVDGKMHARSTGPYSLVTQQPLGGRAHFGGQRIGEMEVWALEAYGAAYTLREMLTVKSDDVLGRIKTYEAIIGGYCSFGSSFLPESFKVMVKEIRALGLSIEMLEKVK